MIKIHVLNLNLSLFQVHCNKLKMYQDHVHYNLRKHFFVNRVIHIWNSLPDSVIEANSVNSFKNRIDKYWNNFEFKYNWKVDLTRPEAAVKVF